MNVLFRPPHASFYEGREHQYDLMIKELNHIIKNETRRIAL